MRPFLRKIYEKNSKTVNLIYYFLKFCYFVLGRYQRLKEETNEAMLNFEGVKTKKMFRKLMVYRYIYYLRASEYYLYDFEKSKAKPLADFINYSSIPQAFPVYFITEGRKGRIRAVSRP